MDIDDGFQVGDRVEDNEGDDGTIHRIDVRGIWIDPGAGRLWGPYQASELTRVFESEREEAEYWATHELSDSALEHMDKPPEGLLPPPREKSDE